jgi:hypothetical protein
VAKQFVSTYIEAIQPAALLPETATACSKLLELLLLEKAFLEIDAELPECRDRIVIALESAVRLLGHDPVDLALPL